MTGALIGLVVVGLGILAAVATDRVLTRRDLREIDDALPGHCPGRIRSTRRARRQLHRDLVLWLVLNADRNHAA